MPFSHLSPAGRCCLLLVSGAERGGTIEPDTRDVKPELVQLAGEEGELSSSQVRCIGQDAANEEKEMNFKEEEETRVSCHR